MQTTGEVLVDLPDRHVEEHEIELTEAEKEVYDHVFSFSQQAMLRYMAKSREGTENEAYIKHVERHGTGKDFKFRGGAELAEVDRPRDAASRMGSVSASGEVKAHHILVLLLRLRQVNEQECPFKYTYVVFIISHFEQICCHPNLIRKMIDDDSRANEGLDGKDADDIDLISQMEDMSIANGAAKEEEEIPLLNMKNPVFQDSRASSKIRKVRPNLAPLAKLHREYKFYFFDTS